MLVHLSEKIRWTKKPAPPHLLGPRCTYFCGWLAGVVVKRFENTIFSPFFLQSFQERSEWFSVSEVINQNHSDPTWKHCRMGRRVEGLKYPNHYIGSSPTEVITVGIGECGSCRVLVHFLFFLKKVNLHFKPTIVFFKSHTFIYTGFKVTSAIISNLHERFCVVNIFYL